MAGNVVSNLRKYYGGQLPVPGQGDSDGKVKMLVEKTTTIEVEGVQTDVALLYDADDLTTPVTPQQLGQWTNENYLIVFKNTDADGFVRGFILYALATDHTSTDTLVNSVEFMTFKGDMNEPGASAFIFSMVEDSSTLARYLRDEYGELIVKFDKASVEPGAQSDTLDNLIGTDTGLMRFVVVHEGDNAYLILNTEGLGEMFDDIGADLQYIFGVLDELPSDEHGYFNSSLYTTPGDGTTTNLVMDEFRISQDRDVHGDSIEFVPTRQEGGVDFGNVYLEPGTYILAIQYTLQWVGNPRGTFLPKVCNVAGRPFDFSYEHEDVVHVTRIVTRTTRGKLVTNIAIDADTPSMGVWVKDMEVVQVASYSHPPVAHDTTLTGTGWPDSPLGVTPAAFSRINDIPTSISQFRAGDVIPVGGPNSPAKMPKDDLLINVLAFVKAQDFFAKEQDLQNEILRATARENEIEGLFSEPVDEAVAAWLDTHPEATTSVQDHSLTSEKLVVGTLNFVTPEMFGAIGDGVTDDTTAINAMLVSGFTNYVFEKTYRIASTITFPEKSFVEGSGKLIYTGGGNSPFIRVLSSSCVKGISIENLGFSICGQNITVDSCIAQGCTHSCFTIDVGEYICEHIRITNCTAKSPNSHGFLFRHRLNGSTGNNSVANDIVFFNCAALNCGQGSSEWSCGFCFDVGSDVLTAKNILFDNCYAYDSIESGFHFEQNIVCENIIFSNCVSNSNGVRKTGGATFGAGYLLPNSDEVRMYGCYATGNYRSPVLTPSTARILKKADVLYSVTGNLDNFVAHPSGSIVFDLARNYGICKSLGIFTYRGFGYGDSNLNAITFNAYKGNWTLEQNKLSFGDETGLPESKGWVSLQLFRVNKRESYTLRFKIRRTTEAYNDVVLDVMLFKANGSNVAYTSAIHLARPAAINTDIDVEYSLNSLSYRSSAGTTNWDGIVDDFELASICFNGSNHQIASQQAVITDLYVQSSPVVIP